MITRDQFILEYATELHLAMKAHPDKYAAGLDPRETATKMADAIEAGSFATDAPALKAMLKKQGVNRYSRKAVQDWYAENVMTDARRQSDKEFDNPHYGHVDEHISSVRITSETELEQYIDKTIYVRTALNAYFGTLVDVKNGLVELVNGHDTEGSTDLVLRVPRTFALAVVGHPPRTPTNDDYMTLR